MLYVCYILMLTSFVICYIYVLVYASVVELNHAVDHSAQICVATDKL
jgi:hypothetical protein